jgi:hypothetical protein
MCWCIRLSFRVPCSSCRRFVAVPVRRTSPMNALNSMPFFPSFVVSTVSFVQSVVSFVLLFLLGVCFRRPSSCFFPLSSFLRRLVSSCVCACVAVAAGVSVRAVFSSSQSIHPFVKVKSSLSSQSVHQFDDPLRFVKLAVRQRQKQRQKAV